MVTVLRMSIVIADMLILGCCVLKDTLKGRRKFWWIIYEVSNLSSIGTARRKAQFLHSFEYPGDVNFCFTTARTWRDRVVGVVIKLRAGKLGWGKRVLQKSRPTLGPSQPPFQRVPGAPSPGVKRPRREADHAYLLTYSMEQSPS